MKSFKILLACIVLCIITQSFQNGSKLLAPNGKFKYLSVKAETERLKNILRTHGQIKTVYFQCEHLDADLFGRDKISLRIYATDEDHNPIAIPEFDTVLLPIEGKFKDSNEKLAFPFYEISKKELDDQLLKITSKYVAFIPSMGSSGIQYEIRGIEKDGDVRKAPMLAYYLNPSPPAKANYQNVGGL